MLKGHKIGVARTVLVFGDGDAARAVLSSVSAKWTGTKQEPRITVTGPLRFSDSCLCHFSSVLLPIVDVVCREMRMDTGSFTLSGVNMSAASKADVGVDISGFSADLSVLIAILSARFQIPVPQDVVLTGHIASPEGDVRLVRNIPAKLEAAKADPSVKRFLCPDPDGDISMIQLAPHELRSIKQSMSAARHAVELCLVTHVTEVAKRVLAEEEVLAAALRNGRVSKRMSRRSQDDGLGLLIRHLGSSIEKRFYDRLEALLQRADTSTARSLIDDWADAHVQRKRFPRGFGRKLKLLLASIPNMFRKKSERLEIISREACISLGHLAGSSDYSDMMDLYKASASVITRASPSMAAIAKSIVPWGHARSLFDIVCADLSRERLADLIGIPIDRARASYVMDGVVVGSHGEALEAVSSFHLHLLRHTARVSLEVTLEDTGADALALLDRSFARSGGAKAALAEARSGVNGGLRLICDRMTDQFKYERQEEYANYVLAIAVDPLDWGQRVAFMKDFMRIHADMIPAEMRAEPPERFAPRYESVVRTYIRSLSQVEDVFRCM